jgi:tight adherence protein C
MTAIIPGAVSLLVTFGLIMILFGVAQRRKEATALDQRMAEFALRPKRLEEIELSRPFVERVIRPLLGTLIKQMSRLTPKSNLERLRQNLEQAGNPYNWQPLDFIGVRGLAAVALAAVTAALMLLTRQEFQRIILIPLLMLGIGYMLPGIWLGQKIKSRKRGILKALPDAIDMLSVSVEAGLGFDQALQRVAMKWDHELSWEFQRSLQEMRVGKSRREALRELAARTGVEDLSTFIMAILMADQLGVSITQVLRIQSAQMRQRRRQRAEVEAHKAPIKMIFPMVFLIFPAIWVVILGPAVPQVLDALGII